MRKLFFLFAALMAPIAPAKASELKLVNGRLFLQAKVNGVPTEALLDSGAEMTLVDPELAEKAGIERGTATMVRGTGGRAKAQVAEDVRLGALGLDLGQRDVVVMELGELSDRLIKRDTAMILGREFFDAGRIQLDLDRETIVLLPEGRRPLGRRLPLVTRGGIEDMPASLGGRAVMATVDFGNGSEPIVSAGLVRKLKLKPIGSKKAGGVGGARLRQLVRLPELNIAGKPIHGLVATVDDGDHGDHLNVGTSVLSHFIVTTDFPGKSIYFAEREPTIG